MNRAELTPIAKLHLSPQSARVFEAAIDVNTSGPAFWAVQSLVTAMLGLLVVGCWSATVWTAIAALRSPDFGVEALGVPLFGFLAILATIIGAAQIRFLSRARG